MSEASQTAGPMPPESPPAATSEQAAEVFAAYGAVLPMPVGTAHTGPRPQTGNALPATGVVSVEEAAAAEVLDAVRAQNRDATSLELAAAEANAGILFDAAHVQEAIDAAAAQARAESQAELAELHTLLAMMAGDHRRVQAVLRLCEGRLGDDMLLVSAVAVAAECGTTAFDGLPMTLTWSGRAQLPDADTVSNRVVVECTSSYGGRADLVLIGDDRAALASLVDEEARDINAKCPTTGCGEAAEAEASDLAGWSRLEIASLNHGPRWYCSDVCVVDALARAGHELAEADRQAEVGGAL